jgi:hypothetical protein
MIVQYPLNGILYFFQKIKKIKKILFFLKKIKIPWRGRGYCTIIFQKILFSENAVKIDINSISNHNNSLN